MGFAHPDELLERLSARQIEEWRAYYQLDPWGEEPAYWRAGVVASTLANIYRKKGAQPLAPTDFFPSKKKQGKKQTQSAMRDAIKGIIAWAKSPGSGVVVKKKGEAL